MRTYPNPTRKVGNKLTDPYAKRFAALESRVAALEAQMALVGKPVPRVEIRSSASASEIVDAEPCERCGGTGTILVIDTSVNAPDIGMKRTFCPDCNGTGRKEKK